MKKLLTILLGMVMLSSIAVSQNGFVMEYIGGGPFSRIDLSNANKTLIGNTMDAFSASDLGPNGILYAINAGDNNFYQIDTVNATTTLIGSITPPANHVWTGMAYDEESGIMYGLSSWGIAAGECSLHIIDISDGSYTLVGTQSIATAIACIAIDGTGQMYGINSGGDGQLYSIDKTDGSVSYIANIGVGVAGMGQGLDFCLANQTMYMTNYNSITWVNTLRTIDLTTGASASLGDIGVWCGTIAIPGTLPLSVDFSSDVTNVCTGGQVNYTDQSTGATSWLWTFEGGTPPTSTDQNPVVTYNTTGTYDVTLEVSDGTSNETLSIPDMITVNDIPGQPDQPVGPIELCGGDDATYTTVAVPMADTYLWEVLPVDAGTITGSTTTAEFDAATDFSGSYTIKVQASNSCGTGVWSQELSGMINITPYPFFLTGGGSYCEGGAGLELTLDGSETGVDYELFLEGVSTGTIVSGTGSPISFGYQTGEGIHTVVGMASICSTDMYGEAYISIDELPEAATQPTGETGVCAGESYEYSTQPVTGTGSLIWTIDPSYAGEITGSGETITIIWSESYAGMADITVYSTNDCGDGTVSDGLEVSVNENPLPEVFGDTLVCEDFEYVYSTTDNNGSTYNWTVEGGEIVSPSNTTSEITVLWNTIGNGSIQVEEVSSAMCNGLSDVLEIVIDDCTNIDETISQKLKVFPNPANGYVVIEFGDSDIHFYDIAVFNIFGNEVIKENVVSGSDLYTLNIENLDAGTYFVKIASGSGLVSTVKLGVY